MGHQDLHKHHRKSFAVFIVLFHLTAGMSAQNLEADTLGLVPGKVWMSSDAEIVALREACWSASADAARARVPRGMEQLGVQSEAVAFARARNDGSYLRFLDSTGTPRRAILHSPLNAHDAHTLLLLSADGSILNVDKDLQLADEQLRRDNGWVELEQRYPNIAIHPADRSPSHLPRTETLRAGRTRVIVEYRLTDGCRACARIGYAQIAYYFDREGRYIARKFLGVYGQPRGRSSGTPADCAR